MNPLNLVGPEAEYKCMSTPIDDFPKESDIMHECSWINDPKNYEDWIWNQNKQLVTLDRIDDLEKALISLQIIIDSEHIDSADKHNKNSCKKGPS